jgi:hypothetical protein
MWYYYWPALAIFLTAEVYCICLWDQRRKLRNLNAEYKNLCDKTEV